MAEFYGKLLLQSQLAELLNCSVQTLRRWRRLGQGPPYLKVVGQIRYRQSEVDKWLESCGKGGAK
jgi:predicted site-specific integrase-resolvase